MSAATPWEQYVDAYHDFWDYLEEHEEILQEESNVTLVRGIMEKCPVVNFSCVRDLIFTMRQFLGEKRFKEKESSWRECLESKIDDCIESISSTEESSGEGSSGEGSSGEGSSGEGSSGKGSSGEGSSGKGSSGEGSSGEGSSGEGRSGKGSSGEGSSGEGSEEEEGKKTAL